MAECEWINEWTNKWFGVALKCFAPKENIKGYQYSTVHNSKKKKVSDCKTDKNSLEKVRGEAIFPRKTLHHYPDSILNPALCFEIDYDKWGEKQSKTQRKETIRQTHRQHKLNPYVRSRPCTLSLMQTDVSDVMHSTAGVNFIFDVCVSWMREMKLCRNSAGFSLLCLHLDFQYHCPCFCSVHTYASLSQIWKQSVCVCVLYLLRHIKHHLLFNFEETILIQKCHTNNK